MADSATNVILAGDPMQLGPIIQSGIARQLGPETSYLERLMKEDIYDRKHKLSCGSEVVKLVENFRSHSAILKFPNDRFYQGDLEACADEVVNAYTNSPYLPSKDFPIVFHAVSGQNLRDASSPSFFNIDEILQVRQYVQQFREDNEFLTAQSDIGVITPYHAQCLKIRTALRDIADGFKVGSLEEFQGQEQQVIIISTVKSSKEFVGYNLRHTLGFVANPRRFNVAITRAKSLLIIVGDPQVLSIDPLWRLFLNYIYLNNGWKGPPITWDPHAYVDINGNYDREIREKAQLDMHEFVRRVEDMTLHGVQDVENSDADVDRPQRDVDSE